MRIGGAPANSEVVTRFAVVPCASPSHLARRGKPANPGDLARHDCLVFASRGRRQGWMPRDGGGPWVRAGGRSRRGLNSGEALRDVAGLGVALLPDFLVGGDLAAGRLRPVLPFLDAGSVEIVPIYPSKRLLELRVRRFIDLRVKGLGG